MNRDDVLIVIRPVHRDIVVRRPVDVIVPVAVDARDCLAAEYERGLACAAQRITLHDAVRYRVAPGERYRDDYLCWHGYVEVRVEVE